VDIASADYWESPHGDPQRLYEAMEKGDAGALGQQTHLEMIRTTTEQSRSAGTC